MKTLIRFVILGQVLWLYACTKTGSSRQGGQPIQLTITSISPTNGPGGTTDTITGSGFMQLPNLDSVWLNGKRLTVESRTNTQLIVTIPRLAGSGEIAIHTANGIFTCPFFKYDTLVIITTLAGSGNAGFINGNGTAASFNEPWYVAVDKAGNVYVSDYVNAVIRKITPDGTVSTFAGGVKGYADGVGTAAEMGSPAGLAFDTLGNLYFADPDNERIRMITPDGVVTTIAGSGADSLNNGPALSATFSRPNGLTVDRKGNIYVADLMNNEIREISNGMVSSVAGGGYFSFGDADGPIGSALFYEPAYITYSPNTGNLYVTDAGESAVRKISGNTVTPLTPTSLYGSFFPTGMAIDQAENVYVGDAYHASILKVDSAGNVTTFAGWGIGDVDGPYPVGSISSPQGVAIDTAGNLYVCDWLNNKVRKVIVQ